MESERRRVSVLERERLNLVWTGEGGTGGRIGLCGSGACVVIASWLQPCVVIVQFPGANTPLAAARLPYAHYQNSSEKYLFVGKPRSIGYYVETRETPSTK